MNTAQRKSSRRHHRGTCTLLPILALVAAAAVRAETATPTVLPSAEQVLQQSRARYASMPAYADTGTVATQYRLGTGPADIERHTFATFYQAPRQFFLDFRKDPKSGTERFVIWGDGTDFHTWWSATHVHETYPPGSGATAFALGSEPTQGAVVLVPPWLFSKAGLQGPLVTFNASGAVAIETLAGHRCYRIAGRETPTYGTGNVAGARAATLWIDAESLMVRKVFEDTPAEVGTGTVSTVTTSFEPQANPTIAAATFRFIPPGAER